MSKLGDVTKIDPIVLALQLALNSEYVKSHFGSGKNIRLSPRGRAAFPQMRALLEELGYEVTPDTKDDIYYDTWMSIAEYYGVAIEHVSTDGE